MLIEFIAAHRGDLLALCAQKSARRLSGPPPDSPCADAEFLDCLTQSLVEKERQAQRVMDAAAHLGVELLEQGGEVSDVVQVYVDVCQAIVELAERDGATIPPREFGELNLRLAAATGAAVAEYSHTRELMHLRDRAEALHTRMGTFAENLRKFLDAAEVAVSSLEGSAVLRDAAGRSFERIRELVDRSLPEIRLESGITRGYRTLSVGDVLAELDPRARMEATLAGCRVSFSTEGSRLGVRAERQLLTDAIGQLVRHAVRATRRGGLVKVRAHGTFEFVCIEVEDQCGGLVPERVEDISRALADHGTPSVPLEPDLAASKRIVETFGGHLMLRNLAGKGCVFILHLPRGI